MPYTSGKIYFVICKNMSEFITYRNKKIKKLDSNKEQYRIFDFVFVNTAHKLLGQRNPQGVFYGNWKEHSEIKFIIEELAVKNLSIPPIVKEFYGTL